MRICIPITSDEGIESAVCEHFGSAPMFMVVDTQTGACRALTNHNAHRGHGMCHPLEALAAEAIDGFVVGGIGQNALARLRHGPRGFCRGLRSGAAVASSCGRSLGDAALIAVVEVAGCTVAAPQAGGGSLAHELPRRRTECPAPATAPDVVSAPDDPHEACVSARGRPSDGRGTGG
jgi:hypothetical protein